MITNIVVLPLRNANRQLVFGFNLQTQNNYRPFGLQSETCRFSYAKRKLRILLNFSDVNLQLHNLQYH